MFSLHQVFKIFPKCQEGIDLPQGILDKILGGFDLDHC